MSAERWLRLRDVFEGALDQSPDRVTQWVEEQAGGDVELRQEVLSLLSHHERAASFLSRPAELPVDSLVDAEQQLLPPGQVVGAYAIVREAGHGGMGRVYVATDTRLNRTVALKVVSGLATDPIQRERLRREADFRRSSIRASARVRSKSTVQLFIASSSSKADAAARSTAAGRRGRP
jgi:serine/threonine-protein kinase